MCEAAGRGEGGDEAGRSGGAGARVLVLVLVLLLLWLLLLLLLLLLVVLLFLFLYTNVVRGFTGQVRTALLGAWCRVLIAFGKQGVKHDRVLLHPRLSPYGLDYTHVVGKHPRATLLSVCTLWVEHCVTGR